MRRALLLSLACLLLLAGFAWPAPEAALSQRLVAPGAASPLLQPGRIEQAFARLPHREGYVDVSSGIALYWRTLDPGAYRLDYAYRTGGGQPGRMDFALDFSAPTPFDAPPRGTVLLLHGWMMDGGSLLPWSLQLAQAGYRTITIDLRNHGRSGAAPSGYGTREARDIADVVAALRADGEITGPLHVMGVSYGAATAIFSARDLGSVIDGVVAIESFENAGHAIRDMVPHLLHKAPETLAQQFTHRWLRWRMDDAALERAIASAGDALSLPLDTIDVGAALADVQACVLLVHGSDDEHVPVAHGRALAAAAPSARYVEVPGEDHISLPMRLDLLAPTVIDWLDHTGQASPARGCPNPLAPA
ncbi:alpha/beta fold hydrolase [Luteimonas aestuarii]|uniref:Alpha/beta fold hydrolase n=1 Tax=Luteimonas aestuarii TaxID=453837 RepID=A0A4R5TTR9_9GAMM|nr:alpha/beta fold hydrolase [Luteimonas aestuarii]TDK24415.1 alpha/beta fold hydrolase [Luteimonas aestuarii]